MIFTACNECDAARFDQYCHFNQECAHMPDAIPVPASADSDQPLADFFIASAPTIQLAIDRYGAQVVIEFFLNMAGMMAANYDIDMNTLASGVSE